MRKILLNSILIFSLLISSVIIAQEEKELFVNSIKGAIKIDGLSNEIQWEKAKWAKDFWMWRPTDTLQAIKQTQFKMLRDEQNLYILIEVTTNGNTFTTPSLKRDFEWYESDSVTLLFDTFNDQTNAFSFATNPLGLKSDGLMSGGNQNYRTDRNYAWDTKWTVETKIEEESILLNLKFHLVLSFMTILKLLGDLIFLEETLKEMKQVHGLKHLKIKLLGILPLWEK